LQKGLSLNNFSKTVVSGKEEFLSETAVFYFILNTKIFSHVFKMMVIGLFVSFTNYPAAKIHHRLSNQGS
jgi:hypothetical protein